MLSPKESGGPAALPVEAVARAGYRALMRGDAIVTPGAANRAWGLLAKVLPRTLAARLTGWYNAGRRPA